VYFTNLSSAYSAAGRYEEAIEMAKRGIERTPGNMVSYICLTRALSMAGRYDEARAAAVEVLKINPKFSLERYAKILPLRDQSYVDRTIAALHKAGLRCRVKSSYSGLTNTLRLFVLTLSIESRSQK